MDIEITLDVLKRIGSPKVGMLTSSQFKYLNETPTHGWQKRLIGKKISQEDYNFLISLKNNGKPKGTSVLQEYVRNLSDDSVIYIDEKEMSKLTPSGELNKRQQKYLISKKINKPILHTYINGEIYKKLFSLKSRFKLKKGESKHIRRELADACKSECNKLFSHIKSLDIATRYQITKEFESKKPLFIKNYITMMKYEDFLKSDYWNIVSCYIRSKSNYICHDCSKTDTPDKLNVHHLTYTHHGNEATHPEDLVLLCIDCHKKRHEIIKNKIISGIPEVEFEDEKIIYEIKDLLSF